MFIFKLDDINEVKAYLDSWLSWVQIYRIPSFITFKKDILSL